MGRPNGPNAESPTAFLRKHAKEPVLPERERRGQAGASPEGAGRPGGGSQTRAGAESQPSRATQTRRPRPRARAARSLSSPKPKLRPPVPPRDAPPVMGLMSDKDWVAANAVDAIASRPPARAPRPGEVDYTRRPGYGKVRARRPAK
jgi:hypothetical protein